MKSIVVHLPPSDSWEYDSEGNAWLRKGIRTWCWNCHVEGIQVEPGVIVCPNNTCSVREILWISSKSEEIEKRNHS